MHGPTNPKFMKVVFPSKFPASW